jgi:hypothetical protein
MAKRDKEKNRVSERDRENFKNTSDDESQHCDEDSKNNDNFKTKY